MTIKKIDLLNLILFVISPFIAIPTILYGVIYKSKFSLVLLILMIGLISYMYIPNYADDRARYFEVYEDFKNSTFLEMFLFFFLVSQDFILQTLFYFASQINLSAQFVFFLVTIISVGFIFFIYNDIISKHKKDFQFGILSIVLLICSISYQDLLSGTRFMFATSFVLLAYYLGIIENKRWSFLLLFVAAFIHFSTLIFIPIFFVLKFFRKQAWLYKVMFVVSLLFIIVPKSFVLSLFEFLQLGGALQEKSSNYLEGNDFVAEGVDGSFGSTIIYYASFLWIFLGYIYLLLTYKKENIYRNIVFFLATIINVFFAVPTIFFRYALLLKLMLAYLLIYELYTYRKKQIVKLFCVAFALILIMQIIVMRNNIEKSFFNRNSLSLITILSNTAIGPNDFIE